MGFYKAVQRRTSLAVGAANLDGSQIVEKLLKLCMLQLWSPSGVRGVMEPVKDNMHVLTPNSSYFEPK